MDQYTVPAIVPPATTGNLSDLVANRATNEPNRITLSRPLGEGWQGVSAKEFDSEVRAVAKGLMAANINVGDRVAIMAKTRYEWTVLDFAIWYAGAVSVPIYETSSAEQVDWILNDSGAVARIFGQLQMVHSMNLQILEVKFQIAMLKLVEINQSQKH